MESLFFQAVKEGNEGEVARLLDDEPARLYTFDGNSRRPLLAAAAGGQLGVMKLLVERGFRYLNTIDSMGQTALHLAGERGHEEVVAFLLNTGAQPNNEDFVDNTPLMLASHKGNLGVVRMLVQHMGGVGLHAMNQGGHTALHHAALGGQDEAVRCLLLAGADPSITNNEGRTPRALSEENQRNQRRKEGCARCVAMFQVRPLTC
jgi:inversin